MEDDVILPQGRIDILREKQAKLQTSTQILSMRDRQV